MVTSQEPNPTRRVAWAYLALFPVGHLVVVPMGGAMATGADLLLACLVGVWLADLAVRREARSALRAVWRGGAEVGRPGRRYLLGVLALAGFGAWVALSSLWSAYPAYALAKGAGVLALAAGAAALATGGVDRRRGADAWLTGTALVVLVTVTLLTMGFLGVEWAGERTSSGGTGIAGLPFRRLSGPFLHPNMLGDYLVVSAAVLWGRWADLHGRDRLGGAILAGGLGVLMAFTASTAWVGAGVGAAWLGVAAARRGRRAVGVGLAASGWGVAAVTAVLLVTPTEVRVAGVHLSTTALRPSMWAQSLEAMLSRPLLGVGASPWLAWVADPLRGAAVQAFDAHNALLSVLGQFGAVGLALALAGVALAAWGGLGGGEEQEGEGEGRLRDALALALLAAAVHSLFIAGEDLRHLWALLGLVGASGAMRATREAG